MKVIPDDNRVMFADMPSQETLTRHKLMVAAYLDPSYDRVGGLMHPAPC